MSGLSNVRISSKFVTLGTRTTHRQEAMAPAAESPACATVELDSMKAAEPLPPAKGLAGKITLSGRFDDDASIQDIQASMDSSLRYQGVATAHGGPAAVSSWTRTAANIVGEIMGGGIMSLPAAMGQLGFVLGSLSILVFSAVVMHVGLVLRRIKLHYHPDAVSYSSVMRNLHGPVAENVTKAIIFVNWFLCAAYYLVSVTNSYAVLAEEANSGICQVILSVIAALTILPAIQIRTFHHMSLLAFVGIVTLMASLILSFVSLALYPKDGAFYQVSSADLWPVGGSGPLFPIQFFGNFGSIIFAFQGQSYFFEMIAEMKRPSEFNKSLFSANGLMTVNYLFTALYCFAVGGRNNPFLLVSEPHWIAVPVSGGRAERLTDAPGAVHGAARHSADRCGGHVRHPHPHRVRARGAAGPHRPAPVGLAEDRPRADDRGPGPPLLHLARRPAGGVRHRQRVPLLRRPSEHHLRPVRLADHLRVPRGELQH